MKKYSKEDSIEIIDRINRIQRAAFHFKKENGREPTDEELNDILDEPIEKIAEIKEILREWEKEDEKQKIELKEATKFNKYVVTDELIIENQEEYEKLKEKIIHNSKLLKDKEKEILYLRFGIENEKIFSISDISVKLDVSRTFTRICIVRSLSMIDNPESAEKMRIRLDNIQKYLKAE